MTPLAPDLFERRFSDLIEIGRARLPALAPDWTDHNAHDPGITLMELLAWVAEAQLYSLSRLRRDERAAYAALLGIGSKGMQAASGLIWPDHLDPNSPVTTFIKSVLIPADTVISVINTDRPVFRPQCALLWVPGHIEKLETQETHGRVTNHTTTNDRGTLPFLPFGYRAGRRDVLTIGFECRDKAGLFGGDRASVKGGRWPIGVLVAAPVEGAPEPVPSVRTGCSPLSATLITNGRRIELRIAFDSTEGLLRTGTLLLDLDDVEVSPKTFSIELRPTTALPMPPRVLRIEPNVIPILQARTIEREPHVANGMPDWSFKLDAPGLRFESGEEPVTVEVAEPSGIQTWARCQQLSEHGPNDHVYVLDANTGEILFGNGVNGRIPPADAPVFVSYSVSEGERGRIARNRKWKVTGFEGAFGVNPDPITGAAAAHEWIQQRREARRRTRDDHALVSADDIARAALALPLLEVARAWVPKTGTRAARIGAVTLVVMRKPTRGDGQEQPLETPQWLQTIRRRLAPRMPLGTRLVVVAPRYVDFSIHAVLEAQSGLNPAAVKELVKSELEKRLAPVPSMTAISPRQPGVPVTRRDIAAWMLATEGVKRIVQFQLRDEGNEITERVAIPGNGLPRWSIGRSAIDVRRPEPGRPR